MLQPQLARTLFPRDQLTRYTVALGTKLLSAPWWIITLVFAAIFLLILDLLVPSAGALLLLALISAISAIVIAFQYNYYWGMGTLITLFAVTPWILFLAIKIWPKTFIGKLMIRSRPDSPDEVLPDTPQIRELKSMVGEIGETETDLMPSGTVKIRGKRFDANSRVGFIAKRTPIEVLAMHLGHLVVAPCSESRLKNLAADRQLDNLTSLAKSPAPLATPASAEPNPSEIPPPKTLEWSLEDERILEQTLDQSLEGIDLSADEEPKR